MKKLSITLIRFYKIFISSTLLPIFGFGCRFRPSCSSYSVEALKKYGFYKGLKMSFSRLLRCRKTDAPIWDPVL